jgi:enterochelin esterase-like enzyme/outer membrane protein assembly factor BamB
MKSSGFALVPYLQVRLHRLSLLAGLACVVVSGAGVSRASDGGDWPSFRGQSGDGISHAIGVFSGRSSVTLGPRWKVSIGSGYAGVAIADGRVVTMFAEGESDVAAAFDEATGKELWRYKIGATYKGHDGSHTGPISTPTIWRGQVFGLDPYGKLFGLDLKTGKERWSTHLVDDHKAEKPHYGFTTSPFVVDGVLIVQGAAKDAAVVGFDPANGTIKWKAGNDGVQYQSPVVLTMHGQTQLVAGGNQFLTSVDAKSGEVLWEYSHMGGGPRGAGSMSPIPAGEDRFFLAYKDDKSTIVDMTFDGKEVKGKEAWQTNSIRNSYNVPVFHEGHVYAYSSRFLTCVDVKNGESVWRSRPPGDGFLILVDGHLVIAAKEGSLHVAEASTAGFKEKGSLDLFDDLIWSPPSFANGSIFVRSLSGLARVDVEGVGTPGKDEPQRHAQNPGGWFGSFLTEVTAATDKSPVVERFVDSLTSVPLIEGDDQIHFLYRGEANDLAVAGDWWGARQEQPMKRVPGTDLFYHSMKVESDARTNYVFLKDYEQILDPLNDRKTSTKVYKEEMEMSFSGGMEMSWVAMPHFVAPDYFGELKEFGPGRIEEFEIDSKPLGTKHVSAVYLPRAYDKMVQRYPVAYIHGGDDARALGQVPEALDHLVGGRIRPIIAVFLGAAPRGKTDEYIEMITTELIPAIDAKYQTLPTPDDRAHVGMGFAGFTALMCAFKHPDVVKKVASQSSFMFDSMTPSLYELIESPDKQPLRMYLDWGKYDLRNPHEAWDLGRTNREFAALLKSKGFAFKGGQVNDGTGWSSWRNRFGDLFETLFPMKRSNMRAATD